MTEWLLMKRGLYYRENDCGYTGIRDHAGRYTEEEARERCGHGVARIRLDQAPEFSEACFDDLARAHLTKQRDEALARCEKLHVVAKNVSHALMSFTPGGSEYFTRLQVGDWEDYYADAEACQRRVRERIDRAEAALREKYRDAHSTGEQK